MSQSIELKKQLFEAVREGNTDSVKHALRRGLSVNITDDNGETALHDAACRGHTPVVRLLLDRGAKVNKRDAYGRTALHWACWDGKPDDSVVTMLLSAGANVNLRDKYGHTALHHACECGGAATVVALLNKGSRIDEQNDSGWTPLHEACIYNRSFVINVLLERGANVNGKNAKGNTPLHTSVLANVETSIIEKLLDFGADIDVRNEDQKTPYELQFKGWWTEGVIDEEDMELRTRSKNAFVRHIVKLKIAGLPTSIDISDELETYEYETIQLNCYEELEKIRKTVIFEDFSLEVVFLKYNEPYYLKTEELLLGIEVFLYSSDSKEEFPIYNYILRNTFETTKYKFNLLNEASGSLKNKSRKKWCRYIPTLVEKQIFSYLSDNDLRSVIKSGSIQLDENKA